MKVESAEEKGYREIVGLNVLKIYAYIEMS
jgi:hypothetical protein